MEKEMMDINEPKFYQNRELSWLDFNDRVIVEALDERNPILEQLGFLSIGSSNLDEFMRVRVAGLVDQYKFGVAKKDSKKNWGPKKQLEEITKKNRKIVAKQYEIYHQKMKEIEEIGYYIADPNDLPQNYLNEIRDIFRQQIEPAITPYGIDAYRPFPHLHDGALQIFAHLEKDNEPYAVIMPISPLLDRYHILSPDENGNQPVVFVEDIIKFYLNELFIGYSVSESFTFRVTRNADLEIQEEGAEDLLEVIEDYIERRKNGMAIRLEVDFRTPNEKLEDDIYFLKETLELHDDDVYYIAGPLDLTFLSDFKEDAAQEHPDLVYPDFTPYYPAVLEDESIFTVLDRQDLFLHHPYDSFDSVVEFIQGAALDERTVSIKMTLYRVSEDSNLVQSLIKAAKSGIQVTVLLELKARFDEQHNVILAKEMEEAGIHILYGVRDLKTHSKITLITKKMRHGFKRYVHLGTGNYHEKTAKQYTDMGILTSNELMAQDAMDFFNYLSGYSIQPDYHHFYVSPYKIRDAFIDKIDREIENQKKYDNGHIMIKMNSFTDKVLINKMYEASQAGVKIDFNIRGICCLIPGIPGVSENIHVRSIVGRFLEHSRVYNFYNNGENDLYLSSADMMTRNMEKRVEIAFPVLDKRIKEEVLDTLQLFFSDNTKAWVLNEDEIYHKLSPQNGEKPISVQHALRSQTQKRIQKHSKTEAPRDTWLKRLRRRFEKKE
ncbi:MAG TPA: polyphosphate kinase 1 [Atopostipes sp.]|nr:polyphosphate kinase 1 [Atopostipes sp.]